MTATRRRKRERAVCRGKVRYRDQMAAMHAGALTGMDWYRCPVCRGWHLTSRHSQPNGGPR